MQSLAKSGLTVEQVKKALHDSLIRVSFRYELLTNRNAIKKNLSTVMSARVENNALADIKRTARFKIVEDGSIDFLNDRIKPYIRFWIEGRWVEWPQGVFLLSTPPRVANAAGSVIRDVQAYDQLVVLIDDKIQDRYTIPTGTNYIGAVRALLNSATIRKQNLTPTTKTLPTDREWPPGTKKLTIINDLLGAVNYRSLFFDENGVALATPYVSPVDRPSEYLYKDDGKSVILPGVSENLDLFGVANKFVLAVSETDRPPLVATYTNDNPDSPTSTVSRGRTIVDFREVEAADQETMDAMVQRVAFEASQVYEEVEFPTGLMPHHGDLDVYTLEYSKLGLSAKYTEMSWGMDLKVGGSMIHRVRRVVSV